MKNETEKQEVSQKEEQLKEVNTDTQTPENEEVVEMENEEKENEQDKAEKRIKELEDKVSSLEDTKLRLMAEFDNYRRRSNKEKLELTETAGEKIFVDMLPLIDDFERALQSMESQDDAVKEGIKLIHQKFLTFLNHHNVNVIETEGKDFSTDEHEAITTLNMGEDKKGKIIDCTQKGYKLGDKVIRYAKVVVGE